LSNCQVRRATIDDLVALRTLWQRAGLPAAELEKRFRECQVVETAAGELLGSIGLQIDQLQGKIHSEAYRNPLDADELRPRLWDRLLTISRNLGLTRLWIRSGSAMFWLEQGFEAADSGCVAHLPSSLNEAQSDPWLTLKLREAGPAGNPAEQELALLRLAQLERAQKLRLQARLLQGLAAVVLVILALLIFAAGWSWLRYLKRR